MFVDNYHHDTIRKYIAYIGALFSNVHIDRDLPDGTLGARMRVPLHFAKIEHALERIIEDPTITRADAIILPAMSYDLVDFKYAAERKQMTRVRQAIELADDPNKFGVMHAPVPYDFHFQVSILVKNINDGIKIIESIVPYFSPDFTAELELIPEMNITTNIPVVLQSAAMEFDVPADYKTRVSYVYVLDFVLQGYLYGPQKLWPVIKFTTVKVYVDTGSEFQSNAIVLSVTTQPGLTANGTPTTDITQTVPYLQIKVSDDFGYIETVHTINSGNT